MDHAQVQRAFREAEYEKSRKEERCVGALGDFWLCKDGGHHFPLPRAAMSRVAGHHVLGHSPSRCGQVLCLLQGAGLQCEILSGMYGAVSGRGRAPVSLVPLLHLP